MTRINCVNVKVLHDKHLLAEYRELPRVFALANPQRLLKGDQPKRYVLGTGHVLFFYDKLSWLLNRQHELVNECLYRGFKINHTDPDELLEVNTYESLYETVWEPDEEDIKLNLSRLSNRLPQGVSSGEYYNYDIFEHLKETLNDHTSNVL